MERCKCVGESLAPASSVSQTVAISFDDGCETNLIAAALVLEEASFNATFYIVAGWLGKKGYLSVAQLRDLTTLGFGCHSMTHRFFTNLDERELHVEIV